MSTIMLISLVIIFAVVLSMRRARRARRITTIEHRSESKPKDGDHA